MVNKEQITAVVAVTLSVLGIWHAVGTRRPLIPPPVVPGSEEPARVQASDYLGGGVLSRNQKLSYDLSGRHPFLAADVFVEPSLRSLRDPPPPVQLLWALPGGERSASGLVPRAPVLAAGGPPEEVEEAGVPEVLVPSPDVPEGGELPEGAGGMDGSGQ